MKYQTIIVAAGNSSRSNLSYNKVFYKIDNEPIIIKTVKNFIDFGSFRAGVICCPVDWIEYTKALLLEYGISTDTVYVVPGGKNRNSSVQNGCCFLTQNFNISDDDIILTHDAVRPFINSRIIKEDR
jgi:2-C-methyl-D-erythritol 4-phosphate cytidylyltransferase